MDVAAGSAEKPAKMKRKDKSKKRKKGMLLAEQAVCSSEHER
jgi:hypothetical protein